MIKNLKLLHYLSEQTYKNICNKLGLDDSDRKTKDNHVLYPDKLIYFIHPFNIIYEQFGHTWFLSVSIDFQKFQQPHMCFKNELFSEYTKLFGQDAMNDFPAFENIYCNYIEYANVLTVDNADRVIKNMAASGCVLEQLNENKWAEYKKPHGTIEFCVSKSDDIHIKTLARCHGTALQKRVKDKSLHHLGGGVCVAKMVDEQTESDIMNWLYAKYKISINK
jgi:hypothetical protein